MYLNIQIAMLYALLVQRQNIKSSIYNVEYTRVKDTVNRLIDII